MSGLTVELANAGTAMASFTAPPVSGTSDLTFRVTVSDSQLTHAAEVTITVKNGPPLCNLARAVPDVLWPPNHRMVAVGLVGVTDPDDAGPTNRLGDGDTSPDAVSQGSGVLLRAERAGTGNGRVYEVRFTADDGQGGTCAGSVRVGVPHSMSPGAGAVADGQVYDSTQP